MRFRRLLIGLGVLALMGAALGTGVALGSSSSRNDATPPKGIEGEKSPARSTPKATLPKSQAYAYFVSDGTIVGPAKKVVAVHHPLTGVYCVELVSSLHVSDYTFANAIADWYHSPGDLTVAEQYSNSLYCPGQGFSNSVAIFVYKNDNGTSLPSDAAVFVTIP